MSNYPPGVSDNSFGAPWNDIEEEITFNLCLEITAPVCIEGPTSKEEIKEIKRSYEIELKQQIMNTIESVYDANVEELWKNN